MKNVAEYARALLRHYLALATGGGVLFAIGVFERRQKVTVPWPIYGAVLFIFTFVAGFKAWREERANAATGGISHSATDTLQRKRDLAQQIAAEVTETQARAHRWKGVLRVNTAAGGTTMPLNLPPGEWMKQQDQIGRIDGFASASVLLFDDVLETAIRNYTAAARKIMVWPTLAALDEAYSTLDAAASEVQRLLRAAF
jgi:hypothetical protein